MGILSTLMQNKDLVGNVVEMATKNPDMLKAAASMLSGQDSSIGGSGGLSGILNSLKASGLDEAVASWVGGGPNQQVSAAEVTRALGSDTVAQFAQKAGVSRDEAGSTLANLLPELVNQLTADGEVPDGDGLESKLASLFA